MSTELSILYVEDNAMLRATLLEYLEETGHQVVAVATAEDALVELDRQRFHILLTDVSLPGKSGIELGRETYARFPETRIILATGFDLANDQSKINIPGATLLPKPFDLDRVDDALAEIAASLS
ncbi:response regulator [Amantichitinum ursilacus]|uniref:Transcriptional regulatory protein OmpR n=1 Tax=Amantichitinum ursilacus TaxID=857265 RepID=A0A0N0GKQ9_9NEIS|nr:response regulator [Amantichitinum ursilacus]KPC49084.1 Transcriptional regulatory protein OmpR [Amantichitinum ursilacus]